MSKWKALLSSRVLGCADGLGCDGDQSQERISWGNFGWIFSVLMAYILSTALEDGLGSQTHQRGQAENLPSLCIIYKLKENHNGSRTP